MITQNLLVNKMQLVRAHKRCVVRTTRGEIELGPFPVLYSETMTDELSTLCSMTDFSRYELCDPNYVDRDSVSPAIIGDSGYLVTARDPLAWFGVLGSDDANLRSILMAMFRDSSHEHWLCRDKLLSMSELRIMGIWNLSPDSFSNEVEDFGHDVRHAYEMRRLGADILDIGAESTNPHSRELPASLEIERIGDKLSGLSKDLGLPISLDSYHLETMRHFENDIDIVNDIGKFNSQKIDIASRMEEILSFLKSNKLGYVAMAYAEHGTEQAASFRELLLTTLQYFAKFLWRAYESGIDLRRIVLDPGIGFGKGKKNDVRLLLSSVALRTLGRPALIGHSRKSFLGEVCGRELHERDNATSLASLLAIHSGANILRVHRVQDAVDARRLLSQAPFNYCDLYV
ncbi:MAG: dihydropteroate synthase [Bradymonadia bacterium]|jgi:dihydropteroate synthase